MNTDPKQQRQSSAEAAGSMQRALNWVRDNNCAASVSAIRPGHEPTILFRNVELLVQSLRGTGAKPYITVSAERITWQVAWSNLVFLGYESNEENCFTRKQHVIGQTL